MPMILHLPLGSPPLMKAAADFVLMTHIGGAFVGIASGTAALLVRKGGLAHRMAGSLFFASMVNMAVIGTAVAPFLPDPASSIGGLVALYLVLTGWQTVKRSTGVVGAFEFAALFLVVPIIAG